MTIHKDRQTALEEGLEHIREEGEPAMVVACQGPPICDRMFSDDDNVAELTKDCPWCTRITVHADGTTTKVEPSRA